MGDFFVDFTSAFNTILTNKLHSILHKLELCTLCNWILDFLTHRTQHVRIGKHVSPTLPMNTGAPQGCMLSPLLMKIADDTTVLGLSTGNDETSYRMEAERLVEWCSDHNLVLNTTKTKEVIINFRRATHLSHSPLLTPLHTLTPNPKRRGGGREGVQLQVSGRGCGRRSVLEDQHHLRCG